MRAVEHGVITTPSRQPLEQRLAEIHARVAELIGRLAPDAVALEDLYVGGNPRTVLSVGQARGAVLAACGRPGFDAAAIRPAEVKKSVCGFGRADKVQVQRMVDAMLGLDPRARARPRRRRAGVAICHAVRSAGAGRLGGRPVIASLRGTVLRPARRRGRAGRRRRRLSAAADLVGGRGCRRRRRGGHAGHPPARARGRAALYGFAEPAERATVRAAAGRLRRGAQGGAGDRLRLRARPDPAGDRDRRPRAVHERSPGSASAPPSAS